MFGNRSEETLFTMSFGMFTLVDTVMFALSLP